MKRVFLVPLCFLSGVMLLLVASGCISVYDPPRHGRVIDADTGESIENVVVMGYWDISLTE
ncbi:hypothetical protein HNR65_003563 [Desulfosalsimonas propionicica]|uniref:Uncharacterized protein n=1 Tax=Desulfosalsimonas propionicica TaxID=332175 RepID=A0A7W0CCG8_9BACT|nr:hypothetical protein [Desulfosalsimonas propionicica]MBA2883201.1 hypothetical protein [Desulfosalsimonas propionicica]